MAHLGGYDAANGNIFGTKTPKKRRKSALEEDPSSVMLRKILKMQNLDGVKLRETIIT